MDNEEIQGVKFSEFPSQTPGNSDEVVGLHSGDNARFSIANIVAAVRQGLASIFVPLTRTINGKGLSTDITLDATDVGAVDTSDVGVADGVASLDSTGKVPGTQLDLSGKQSTITASGILKGDGQGGVSAATAGTDYQAPLTAGTDYATPAQLEGKANQAQLAAVESGNTATINHPENSLFCWNGYLYKATTAIAVGDSFADGQNCEKTTVADNKESVWTFIAEKTGTAAISLPTPWKELLAEVYYDNIHWPVHIIRETLRGTYNFYRHGYYYNNTYNGGCSVSVSNTQANLQSCYTGLTERTNNTLVRYYWR